MDKLKMHSLNKVEDNIEKIGKLFPNCLTERKGKGEQVELAIDFDMLRQELSSVVVEGTDERYQFTWPDKRKSILLANAPIAKTLRPCAEESVAFDTTENLYIEGDNLDVLKLLQETYLGKVKMIYIDPPYNTNNDFVYKDNFSQNAEEYLANSGQYDEEGNRLVQNNESNGRFHTDWLNMIYPRLKVAKDLLADDGVIFISIDDNEVENLKKIGAEVFGEDNFVGQWNWFKSATPPNLSHKIKKNIEYIIAFEKSRSGIIYSGVKKNSPSDDPMTKPQNSIKILKFAPNTINFKLEDQIIHKGIYGTEKYPNELLNDLVIENGKNKNEVSFSNRFIWLQEKLEKELENGTVMNCSKSLVLSYKKNDYSPEVPPNLIDSSVGVDTTEEAGKQLSNLIGDKVFNYPKPTSLIKYLIGFKDNDLILDFFSGSATTAHAVMQLNVADGGNRKFICVQLPEATDKKSGVYKNICEIGKERIRRAGKKIVEENKDKEGIEKLDIGFRVLKLDSTNMKKVYYNPAEYTPELFATLADNIKQDRTPEDLLFQVMLELGVLLSSKIEQTEIDGKRVFNVANGYLIACFDDSITESTVTAIAKQKPYYFAMRDYSMASDSVATNFKQIFETYSKDTIRRVL